MNFLQRTITTLANLKEPPERTALAFSLGILLGFSPFFGLHTLMGLGATVLFRLNKIALMMGVWINVPWVAIPYYGFATWLGIRILGTPEGRRLPRPALREIVQARFWLDLIDQWWLLLPALVGSAVLCVLMAVVAYPLSLFLIRKYRELSGNRWEA